MEKQVAKYEAARKEGEPNVLVWDYNEPIPRGLSPARSLRLRNHSPTGFEWGYGGSGPAQLALAILLDFTDKPQLSLRCYQDFKRRFIAPAGKDGFSITAEEIKQWLKESEVEK